MDEDQIEKEKSYITGMDMPHYPLLPVVNRAERKSGIIIAGDNQRLPLKVYLGNIFSLKDDGIESIAQLREKYECIEFQTLDVFLRAGWVVD